MLNKKWSLYVLLTSLVILFSIALFNYFIDPYQIYKKHSKGFLTNDRYQTAGLINSYLENSNEYDCVIIGTSMTQNFMPKDIQNQFKSNKVLRLSISGASSKVQYTVLKHALKTKKVKNVFWGVGHYFTTEHPDKIQQSKSMPFFLYESKYSLNTLKQYLLNYDVLLLSVLTFIDKQDFQKDLELLGYWGSSSKYLQRQKDLNNQKNIHQLEKSLKNSNIKDFNYSYNNFLPALDKNLLSLIKQYPKVNFILFFPPYSAYYYTTKDNSFVNKNISMRRYLVENLNNYNNVKIYAFDNADFTKDLKNYVDYEHYDKFISHKILQLIKLNTFRLNKKNIDEYEKEFINKIKNYKVYSSYKENQNDKK